MLWKKRHLLGALTTLQYWIIQILNKPTEPPSWFQFIVKVMNFKDKKYTYCFITG